MPPGGDGARTAWIPIRPAKPLSGRVGAARTILRFGVRDATMDARGRRDSKRTGLRDSRPVTAARVLSRARLQAVVISTIDLSQDRLKNRQQRWEVFRNRRPDDVEIDIEIRVDQAVSH